MLIMPDALEGIIHQRAEQIRQKIEQYETNHEGNRLTNITVSIGVACYPQKAESIDGMVKAADTALYRAKESGRNKVVIAE